MKIQNSLSTSYCRHFVPSLLVSSLDLHMQALDKRLHVTITIIPVLNVDFRCVLYCYGFLALTFPLLVSITFSCTDIVPFAVETF